MSDPTPAEIEAGLAVMVWGSKATDAEIATILEKEDWQSGIVRLVLLAAREHDPVRAAAEDVLDAWGDGVGDNEEWHASLSWAIGRLRVVLGDES